MGASLPKLAFCRLSPMLPYLGTLAWYTQSAPFRRRFEGRNVLVICYDLILQQLGTENSPKLFQRTW